MIRFYTPPRHYFIGTEAIYKAYLERAISETKKQIKKEKEEK